MGTKSIVISILIVLGLIAAFAVCNGYMGQNDDENWQVLQGIWGKMRIQTDAGYYQKKFASDYTYPKLRQTYFSDDVEEGGAKDGSCNVIFKDKGRAKFNSNVVYNTPYILANDAIDDTKKGLVKCPAADFHRLCKGDVEKADRLILARLKEYAIGTAEKLNASDCAENQSVYIAEVRKLLRADELLVSKGIDIEELALSGFTFDDMTLEQFATQQKAILASKEAEAKAIQFEMQKLETEAEYAQKIAVEKGMAEMEMMKQTTDAQRDAELATIEAQKEVDVATLAKEKAIVEADKLVAVAGIEKEAALVVANQGLEVAEIAALEAEQKKIAVIAAAQAKKEAIDLSGAITEQEEILAKIAAERDVKVAMALKDAKVPAMIINGQGGEAGGSTLPLMNIALMKAAGILPADFSVTAPQK